jgi:imidazolonepropionase-like amidohydrolase
MRHCFIINIMVHALRSRRVVTPHGELDAAIVIDGERIVAIKPASELDASIAVEDLGDLALLPGLVDAHTSTSQAAPNGRVSPRPRAPRPRAASPPSSTCR